MKTSIAAALVLVTTACAGTGETEYRFRNGAVVLVDSSSVIEVHRMGDGLGTPPVAQIDLIGEGEMPRIAVTSSRVGRLASARAMNRQCAKANPGSDSEFRANIDDLFFADFFGPDFKKGGTYGLAPGSYCEGLEQRDEEKAHLICQGEGGDRICALEEPVGALHAHVKLRGISASELEQLRAELIRIVEGRVKTAQP